MNITLFLSTSPNYAQIHTYRPVPIISPAPAVAWEFCGVTNKSADSHTSSQAVAPGGAITSSGPSVSYNSGFQAYAQEEEEEEPQVIKEWRAKRDEANAKRADQFARQREETVAEAQKNIDDFYENYNNKKEKTIAATRKDAEQFLASREDTTSGGTSWERIAKIVDVSGKGAKGGAAGSGKERFRELLTSLRKDEKAPGSTGY